MTREEAKDLSNVLKAYSEGKIIQYQQNGIHRHADLRFYDCPDQDNISFNVKEYNYRIKPEQSDGVGFSRMEMWMARNQNGSLVLYKSKPYKDMVGKQWMSDSCIPIDPFLFPEVDWTDEEPRKIGIVSEDNKNVIAKS